MTLFMLNLIFIGSEIMSNNYIEESGKFEVLFINNKKKYLLLITNGIYKLNRLLSKLRQPCSILTPSGVRINVNNNFSTTTNLDN